jgi:hypothetical protein
MVDWLGLGRRPVLNYYCDRHDLLPSVLSYRKEL